MTLGISGQLAKLPPVPDDKTAAAMFTAHRLNDILTELAHASERMLVMRKTGGELRHYHGQHFLNHTTEALNQAALLKDNMLRNYPAEAAQWRAIVKVMNLATGYDLNKRSGMISLDLAPGTISLVPGGVADHHITVVYLGPDVDDDAFEQACDRAREAASAMPGPLTGSVGGIGTFQPKEGGDKETPAWAGVVLPGAERLRSALEDLSASKFKDWKPHVTLAFVKPGEALPQPVPHTPVTFTHLSVHRGEDEVARFPLGGGPAQLPGDDVSLAVAVNPPAKAASFAHLLQTIMYDGAHAEQHARAMLADQTDPEWKFDADHAVKHMHGAREHALKLAGHIRDNYPAEWRWLHELVLAEDFSNISSQALLPVTISGQVAELGWEHQPRDPRGRWTAAGAAWDAEHAKMGDDVHDSLVASRPRLSSEQEQRVRHYTGDGFSEMNRRLREGTQDAADKRGTDELDRIVRGSVAQHDMVLLHGRADLADVKPGDRIRRSDFLSATTDSNVAKIYGGVGKGAAIVRVRLKKGEPALSTRGLSDNPTEKEVVLPKGQGYTVLKVQQARGLYGQPVRLVDVELDHGPAASTGHAKGIAEQAAMSDNGQ